MGDAKRIGVYGATGFTGALVAAELDRRGVPFLVAGRDVGRLEALSRSLGTRPETLAARIDDKAALARLCAAAPVLINCAGPFTLHGPPVVEAALAAGSHYADTTGEQAFMKLVRDRHHEAALARGVCLLPGAAYEYAVSDLFVPFSVEGFDAVEAIDVAYLGGGSEASAGTRLSALEILRSPVWWAFEDGRFVETAGRIEVRQVPSGRGDRTARVMRFPGGEVVLFPIHVAGIRQVRTYIGYIAFARAARLALRLPGARAVAGWFLRRGSAGPAEAAREAATFTICHEVRGRVRADPAVRRFAIRGRDPYGLTAKVVAEIACRMSRPDFQGKGVTAPAAVFDCRSFRAFLESCGVTLSPL